MSDVFDTKLVNPLLQREGGEKFTNHPSDRGGPTKWGVTAAKLGEFRKLGRAASAAEVAALTRDEAVRLYRAEFWEGPGFDQLPSRSLAIAEEVFDTGVNMGVGVAARFLQEALNSLNRQGRDYPDIPPGAFRVGPKTLAGLDAYLKVRGVARGVPVLLKALNSLQGARYIQLGQTRPANEDFMFGWLEHRVA
jgi:lysozyme family protein